MYLLLIFLKNENAKKEKKINDPEMIFLKLHKPGNTLIFLLILFPYISTGFYPHHFKVEKAWANRHIG